jgi:hypothetical protein
MRDQLSWFVAACLGIAVLAGAVALGCAPQEKDELPVIDVSGGPAFPLDKHLESSDLAAGAMTFEELFEAGDDLFHTAYNGLDGIGALRLPDGSEILRFHAAPPGGDHGAPISSQSCGRCHLGTASGPAQANVAGDPDKDGHPPFNIRSATSLWGNGILQLLAQEITEDLQAIRDEAAASAQSDSGARIERALESKGISYGVIAASVDAEGNVSFDLTGLQGADPDLVVRPLGWKGSATTVRSNTVGAAAALMGLQAEELTWKLAEKGAPFPDPDGDGVERELSVGDMTAMVVYGASQETPQSVERLAELGLVAPPSDEDRGRIERGRIAFGEVGCDSCHLPELRLHNSVFEEPTARGNGHYYDQVLAAKDPDYDPQRPVRFDLLQDAQEPRAEAHPEGGAIIRAYGDLKRHHMGRQLAEPAGPQPPFTSNFAPLTYDDEPVLIAANEFLTPELWGVGNTGPWLHDGRASILREAIMWHGEDDPPAVGDPDRSEAQEARDAFGALGADDQEAVLTFLRSLRTFQPKDD